MVKLINGQTVKLVKWSNGQTGQNGQTGRNGQMVKWSDWSNRDSWLGRPKGVEQGELVK